MLIDGYKQLIFNFNQMNLFAALLTIIYITIIVGFIWARFRYFKIQSFSSRIGSIFYDPIVTMQIAVTLYLLLTASSVHILAGIASLTFYVLSLAIFWWSIVAAKQLDFAFSDNVGKIVTTGPFAYVRHPFYLSYILVWLGSSILFNSIFLWITLIYLTTLYFTSAKIEEEVYLKSEYSREYRDYSHKVRMFLPRITLWKN